MRDRFRTLAAAGLLLAGTAVAAQNHSHYRTENGGERRDQVFDQVRSDLKTAEHSAIPLTGKRYRANYALEEVNLLQQQVDRGTYDRKQFNQAIRAVQQVANQHGMPQHTWDALSSDASRLRMMEARNVS
jgi:hypothetical protein